MGFFFAFALALARSWAADRYTADSIFVYV